MPIIHVGEGYVEEFAGVYVIGTVSLYTSRFVPGFGIAGEVDIPGYGGKYLVVKLLDYLKMSI